MVSRKCCIKNCVKEAGAVGKKVPVYKFPAVDSDEYARWIKLIGANIDKGKFFCKQMYICALHFDKDCFEKDNVVIVKDGKEVTLTRKVQRLKRNVVPSIFNDTPSLPSKTPRRKKSDHSLGTVKLKTPVVTPQQPIQHNSITANSNITLLVSSVHPSQLSSFMLDPKIQPDENNSSQSGTSSKINANSLNVLPRPVLNVQLPAASLLLQQNCKSISSASNPVLLALKSECVEVPSVPMPNLPKMYWWDNWTNCRLPPDWTLSKTTQGLMCVNISSLKYTMQNVFEPSLSCLVRNDNTVEIRVMDQVAKYPSIQKITNFNDLYESLARISVAKLCTGVDELNSCNVLFIPVHKSSTTRCSSCRFKRRLIKEKERQQQRRLETQQKRKAIKDESFKNLKQKYARALKKIETLQNKLKASRNKSFEIKQESNPSIEKIYIVCENYDDESS